MCNPRCLLFENRLLRGPHFTIAPSRDDETKPHISSIETLISDLDKRTESILIQNQDLFDTAEPAVGEGGYRDKAEAFGKEISQRSCDDYELGQRRT